MSDAVPQRDPSRARDHLANERTFLAWLRTALAVMTVGLGIVGFVDSSSTSATLAGGTLVGVGAVGLGYGTLRYRQVNRQIESGVWSTGGQATGATVASIVLAVALIAALIMLTIGRT